MREQLVEAVRYDESLQREVPPEEAKLIIEEIEGMLKTKEHQIGIGTTAEVHTFIKNEKNCFKIISTREKLGTIQKSEGSQDQIWYQPLRVEAKFLEHARSISNNAKVPRPYYTLNESVTIEEEDEKKYEQYTISALAMETLNAVTLDEVLFAGKENLPKNFDCDAFFKKLRLFVKDIHAGGMYHRDIHAGNVMVDRETGEPCVIDFGRACYSSEEEAYTQEITATEGGKRVRSVLRFTSDEMRVDSLEKSVRTYVEWKKEAKN
jgi:tRNA A-37 threonylcarbamoyl transferase component Bud32